MSPDPLAASLNVRMTLELRRDLQDVADQHGVDVSHVARLAISEGLQAADRVIANAIDEADAESIATAIRRRGQAQDAS